MKIKQKISSMFSGAKRVAGNAVGIRHIKQQHNYIGRLAKVAFVPEHKRREVYQETFEEAIKRNGTTPDEINKIHRNYTIIFYTQFIYSLILLGFASKYAAENSIVGVLSSLSIMLITLALCFKYSFRAYQIKERNLCSVNEWLASRDYLPFFTK